jgi:hypothetical protein
VELKRPELSEAEWLDKDGNSADKGLVGEALKLQVSCNADTEEGAGVIFKVYPDGADPGYDQPVAELSSANQNGKAEAEWTYRYEHDPENPLKEKPKYFFTASGQRCKEVTSGTVEIGMDIDIPVYFDDGELAEDLVYTLIGADGTEEEGKAGKDGKIRKDGMIPNYFRLTIDRENYKPSNRDIEYHDLDMISDGLHKIIVNFAAKAELQLEPGRNYVIILNREAHNFSV